MKIILHLGFPKSASSTLQFGLWQPLAVAGKIKLLTWRMTDPKESLEKRPSSRLFTKKEMHPAYLKFIKNIPNILSDESFTAPIRLRRNNFGENIEDPRGFPAKIKQQIQMLYGEDVTIVPLIVLRNHVDLVFSQYVEEYNLKKYMGQELIFEKDGETIDLSGFDIYNFHSYISEVEAVFGSNNTKVLFFEQIRHDFKNFCQILADLSHTNSKSVASCFKTQHINSRKKTKNGYWTQDNSSFIKNLDDKQKGAIVKYFSTDTELLCDRFSAQFDLQRFGYLY